MVQQPMWDEWYYYIAKWAEGVKSNELLKMTWSEYEMNYENNYYMVKTHMRIIKMLFTITAIFLECQKEHA